MGFGASERGADDPGVPVRVVKVPTHLRLHPDTMLRYEKHLAELERLMTPSARAAAKRREAEFVRRVLGA
jgi:hypothetical protein